MKSLITKLRTELQIDEKTCNSPLSMDEDSNPLSVSMKYARRKKKRDR
jgi:hypothetical protein